MQRNVLSLLHCRLLLKSGIIYSVLLPWDISIWQLDQVGEKTEEWSFSCWTGEAKSFQEWPVKTYAAQERDKETLEYHTHTGTCPPASHAHWDTWTELRLHNAPSSCSLILCSEKTFAYLYTWEGPPRVTGVWNLHWNLRLIYVFQSLMGLPIVNCKISRLSKVQPVWETGRD